MTPHETMDNEEQQKKDVLMRIRASLGDIEEIRKLYRVPSISLGVLHQGEIIFRESLGVRDNRTQDPANADTLYHLASVSKGFLSALAGIAVAEGKLKWTAPVATYLPEFNPFDNPDVGKKVRILDCLRHTTGLGNNFACVVGPRQIIM